MIVLLYEPGNLIEPVFSCRFDQQRNKTGRILSPGQCSSRQASTVGLLSAQVAMPDEPLSERQADAIQMRSSTGRKIGIPVTIVTWLSTKRMSWLHEMNSDVDKVRRGKDRTRPQSSSASLKTASACPECLSSEERTPITQLGCSFTS